MCSPAPVSFTVSPDPSGIQVKVPAFFDASNTAFKFLADRPGVSVTRAGSPATLPP